MARKERYLVGLDVGTSKVTAVVAEILDGGDFALHGGDFLFDPFDEGIDGVFLAAIIEDKGGVVLAVGGVHGGSLRLS